MSRSLVDLPTELLSRIVTLLARSPLEEVPDSYGKKRPLALCALCLTCRLLYDLTSPLLVTRWSSLEEEPRRDFTSFLDHLLFTAPPAQRAKVRSIGIDQWETEAGELGQDSPGDGSSSPSNRGQRYVRAAEAECPWLVAPVSWAIEHSEAVEDKLLALQLAIVPGLEELQLSIPYAAGELGAWRVLRRTISQLKDASKTSTAPSPNLPLANLRHLYLRWWDTEDALDLRLLAPFMNLPHLESVHCFMITSSADMISMREMPVRTSSVTKLILEAADLDDTGLTKLCGACKALTHLEVRRGDACVGDNEFTSLAMARAAAIHADTLRHLVFDGGESFHMENEDPGDMQDVLTRLTRLETLEVDLRLLYGLAEDEDDDDDEEGENEDEEGARRGLADLLPSTELRHLTLLSAPPGHVDLLAFLAACGGEDVFPKLKTIDLSSCNRKPGEKKASLREAARAVDIELEF